MNSGEIIDQVRRITGDVEEPYLCNDDEFMKYLNEAVNEASKRSFLNKTSDPAFLEVPSKGIITVSGVGQGAGFIKQILVDNQNIITNSVAYDTAFGDVATSTKLANEINSTGLFIATIVAANIVISPIAGSGSQFNNLYPIINQDAMFATAGQITGGVDGICRFSLLPNKKEYKFSDKILKFENFYFGNMEKNMQLSDYRSLNDSALANYNQKGKPDTIIYGMSNTSFIVGKIPDKKCFLTATVFYKPSKPLIKASDIPEIPDEFHSKLVDYILFKVYNKVDAEIDHLELADRHKKLFEEEFNDNSMTNAFEQKNTLSRFFNDMSSLNNYDL